MPKCGGQPNKRKVKTNCPKTIVDHDGCSQFAYLDGQYQWPNSDYHIRC